MHIIETARAGVIENATPISNIGINVLNFLLSVMGIIAIVALVISGFMYFTAMGDEKQVQTAKTYAEAATIGIVAAMGGMIATGFIGSLFRG